MRWIRGAVRGFLAWLVVRLAYSLGFVVVHRDAYRMAVGEARSLGDMVHRSGHLLNIRKQKPRSFLKLSAGLSGIQLALEGGAVAHHGEEGSDRA